MERSGPGQGAVRGGGNDKWDFDDSDCWQHSTTLIQLANTQMPCGGHRVQLSFNATAAEAAATFAELAGSGFIDRQTRVLVVEFFVVNVNTLQFAYMQIVNEQVCTVCPQLFALN